MDDGAIPTEASAAERDGSRDDNGSSDESIKSDCRSLFIPKKWTNEKHNLYLRAMETSFLNELYNNENVSSDLLGFKHNLYLRAMETSFLNQLYNNENASSDLLGFLPLVTPKPTRKLGSTSNFFHFSCQFEFSGRRSHNFASKRAQFEIKEVTQLFENPWIRRFTSRGTLDRVDSNELINLAMPSSNRSPNHKPSYSSRILGQHYAVTDQNFDDIEYKGQSDARAAKRKRDHIVNHPVQDSST